ncbi:hypothetical protein ACWGTI_25810 [Mesorhizobium sp. ArgA1]
MKTSELRDVAATLARIATPAMAPKELVKAVKAVHPKASRNGGGITVRFFKGNLSWTWVGQADGQPYNAVAVLTRQ